MFSLYAQDYAENGESLQNLHEGNSYSILEYLKKVHFSVKGDVLRSNCLGYSFNNLL